MIELWTEDSTAGYRFMKNINKVKYNNQLKVIPHNGIGDSNPSSVAKYGGILHHLKNYTDKNLVLLYIDKAIDIQGTAENYENVVNYAAKYPNVFIIEQVCFELNMLSYKNLFNVVGNKDLNMMNIAQEFSYFGKNLKQFRPKYFSNLLCNYMLRSCGRKVQYEHVAKMILADITNVATVYGKKSNYLGIISGGDVGPCWMKDCCVIPTPYQHMKKCSIPCSSLNNKIGDIVNNSYLKEQIEQIDNIISIYIKKNYKCVSTRESFYRTQYEIKFSNKYIIKHIGKLMEIHNYWSYERLFTESK